MSLSPEDIKDIASILLRNDKSEVRSRNVDIYLRRLLLSDRDLWADLLFGAAYCLSPEDTEELLKASPYRNAADLSVIFTCGLKINYHRGYAGRCQLVVDEPGYYLMIYYDTHTEVRPYRR